MTDELFDAIVGIAEEFLGPTAKRFMSRQIIFHLQKNPTDVSVADIPKLAEWTRVTVALLTEDKGMIDNLIGRLLQLSEQEVKVENGG